MRRYKEIENNIEYEVFELDESELYYQVREIEKIEYSKVIRLYDNLFGGCKDIFYFHKGEAHNEWGPCAIRLYENGDCESLCYYFDGDRLTNEEWKVYYRTKMIDKICCKDEKSI